VIAISALVTAYNCAPYLGEALASVLAQTYPVAEVIVLDDGSSDAGATARAAQSFGERVRYLHQPHQGIGACRNAAAAAAQGDWLAYLDGDDLWEPGKLERQAAALAADPALEAVFTHIRQFVSPDIVGTPAGARLVAPANPMPGRHASCLLVARAALERLGGFATHLDIGEFIDWYARAEEAGLRMTMLPEVLAARRIHATNNSLRQTRQEYAQVLKTMLDRRRAGQKAHEA
jgi:glycosyltransferase involved in cell wall biosynthesis